MRFEFSDYSLDVGRRELRRGASLIQIEPQVFDLLVYLIENRERVVTKDDLIASVWGGRIVSESTLTSRITAVRKAVGDTGERQHLIRTMSRKGIRFVGELRDGTPQAAVPAGTASRRQIDPEPAAAPTPLHQEIHFCTAPDGVRIAYAEVGEGPPLVKAANWLNHLEYDWESPIWSHVLHELAESNRLIRYDQRGNGLSDWDVDDISLDTFVRDQESVVDAARLDRFALLGISQGCAVSIAYAVQHPERVRRLVLYAGYARGRRKRNSQQEIERADLYVALMREGWGKDNPAFRQFFTSLFVPGATGEQMQWFNDLQRKTTSPESACRIRLAHDNIDVLELLPQVRVPTLVLHCRDDAVVPFDEGRRLAAGIPGARFVALEGRNHLILETDPGWSRFAAEVKAFLKE